MRGKGRGWRRIKNEGYGEVTNEGEKGEDGGA